MALGSYSVVRYSNTLNDQRVNLGVLIWHPHDGFRSQFASSLERIHTIDPTALLGPLQSQIKAIQDELSDGSDGNTRLELLSRWFRNGVEVSEPYPARIQSLDEFLATMFQRLVSLKPPQMRASSQAQFERTVKAALKNAAQKHKFSYFDKQERHINGLTVTVGPSTVAEKRGRKSAVWQSLSLHSVEKPKLQLALAKATAEDISVIRELTEFKNYRFYVTLRGPKPAAASSLSSSLAWLKREADDVFVEGSRSLPEIFEQVLA